MDVSPYEEAFELVEEATDIMSDLPVADSHVDTILDDSDLPATIPLPLLTALLLMMLVQLNQSQRYPINSSCQQTMFNVNCHQEKTQMWLSQS